MEEHLDFGLGLSTDRVLDFLITEILKFCVQNFRFIFIIFFFFISSEISIFLEFCVISFPSLPRNIIESDGLDAPRIKAEDVIDSEGFHDAQIGIVFESDGSFGGTVVGLLTLLRNFYGKRSFS